MRKEITKYFEKINKDFSYYYDSEDFNDLDSSIKCFFERYGFVLKERTDKTDISLFKKEFGFQLPDDIAKYINIFWHPSIYGYLFDSECIVLFSVLKKEGDSCDEVLFYKNGLMEMARNWDEVGDINKYIPIGWLSYSGTFVLYEISTGEIFLEDREADVDGLIEEKPIAESMSKLIENLKLKN